MRVTTMRSYLAMMPKPKPTRAAVTPEGLIMYMPWWSGPVRLLRMALGLAALLALAIFLAYTYIALRLVRLLLGVRPELHIVWPDVDAQDDTPELPAETKPDARWHSVAGKKVFGRSVTMDEVADEEPF